MTHTQLRKVMGVLLFAAAVFFLCRVTNPAGVAGSSGGPAAASSQARITQPIDETQLVKLRGNVPPLARPEFDRGPVADSVPMNRMLLLLQRSPEQEAALEKLLEEQQIKGSPNFHKWLTPDEFGKQFGPADADIQTVAAWLESKGFAGIKVVRGRTVIEFSGNVGLVRDVFHTAIHQYNVEGKLYQANVSDPSIPAALAPVVAGIVSLNNFPRQPDRRILGAFQRTASGRIVPQLTTTSGCGANGSQPCYALGPADFATIYNSVPLLTAGSPINGAGVKIGVVADSNINASDVNDFRSLFGLPTSPPTSCPPGASTAASTCIVLDGPDPGLVSGGGETEADLDTEWAGAVAPGATIDLIVSEDTLTAFGADLSALYIVDNNSDDILSTSFSACEALLGTAGNAFYNSLWEEAAAQGITVAAAAGDGGSAGCDNFDTESRATGGLAVNGLASTPFNTAVGGTDFDDVGTQSTFWSSTNTTVTGVGNFESAKGYIPEMTWNDSCAATATTGNLTTCAGLPSTSPLLNIFAGSGGPSSIYPKPAWQTQSDLTPADSHRDTPDVALFASDGAVSSSFYVACEADALSAGSPPSCSSSGGTFSFIGIGGTSAATPAFAGVMALIEQTNGRQGNANVILYKIAHGETFSNCNSSTTPLSGGPASCPFNDITKGNNSVPCVGGTPNCSATSSTSTGVLVDPANTTTPAWITKTGYDFATGLGSININNLATAWPGAVGSLTGTTTALTTSATMPIVITHGQSISFTATVAPMPPATGTPTGDVSLLALMGLPNSAGAGATLSGTAPPNDSATITTTTLPGGTYSVTAHYAGDTTFAPSDSNSIPVTVGKENSGLQIGIVTFDLISGAITSTNATSFAYGSPYILQMNILNSTGNASNCQPLVTGGATTGCAFDATGTITLTDNGAPPPAVDGTSTECPGGACAVNSQGEAEVQMIQLPAGTHTLSATYSGDVSFNPPSGPVTDMVTVSKATTTAAVASNLLSITSGAMVTLTATISSNSNSSQGPTGTVQFLKNGSSLGSAVTCVPVGATSTTGAFCTATLPTAISQFPPGLVDRQPRQGPPAVLIWFGVLVALLCVLLASFPSRRRGYAYAGGMVLFLLLAAGFFGCGGGSSTPAPTTVSITAQYSGDSNYAASSSSPIAITVQ
jgi:hypothetical protein